ncbi:MAG: tetratricopeptide repeat protein [Gemmatimonadetes bacterium]|nr:tetratricopeptide repeat protein [Gemmatimonadota bacterium]
MRAVPAALWPAALLLLPLLAVPLPAQQAPAPAKVAQEPPEATSLLGMPLHRPPLAPETRDRLEQQLADARADYTRNPLDPDRIIWLGRRTAYLGRYREAIAIFSEGAWKYPEDPRFYRHRGHRYITVRELDNAIRDLEQAAALVRGRSDQVEPDGMPNPYNIPTSTLQSNIWYHLGLAYYLQGDFEKARAAYLECLKVSTNDDMLVATTDWLYLTYRRLGRPDEARKVLRPVHEHMRILENHAYHRRLLLYKGELPVDSFLNVQSEDPVELATYGYGVGTWYLVNGQRERALAMFRKLLEGKNWAAFGYIAAEAELARYNIQHRDRKER